MYHEGWLMQQIKGIAAALARIFFNTSVIVYEIKNHEQKTETDMLYLKLQALLEEKSINEAESLLFSRLDPQDVEYMRLAIDFYSKLNDMSDDELESCDFSREEINDGYLGGQRTALHNKKRIKFIGFIPITGVSF